MMHGNRGATSLKRWRRQGCAMREYDRLPPELRFWLARAALPWRPGSARRAYERALAATHDPRRALQELDRLQDRLLARDAAHVWPGDAG